MTEQLLIRGRDRTQLLESIERQRQVVRHLLDALPGGATVPLHLAMCFVDADLPMTTEKIRGIALLGSKQVARRLNKQGPVPGELRATLMEHLTVNLPAA